MDNEATKILNPQQNSAPKKEQVNNPKPEQKEDVTQTKEKKGAGIGVRVAATAAGAALGTSAAMAAEHIYAATMAETEDDQNQTPTYESAEEKPVETSNHDESSSSDEIHATVAQEHEAQEHEVRDVNAVPEDGTYIDSETEEPTPTSTGGEENEIHIVGVAVQENGQGGLATIAGLQSSDDSVIVVDVESDGRLDYAIHDDNGDGQIDNSEWHDISGENMETSEVINAYVEEAHVHGATAVVTDLDNGSNYQITETEDGYGMTSMDDAMTDENMMTASNDDMPDYMNDADAGMMDA